MTFHLLSIVVVSLVTTVSGARDVNVAKAFKAYDLTPEVISTAPQNLLNVRYPTADACLGDEISQTRTMMPPKVVFDFKPGVNYTIMMIDPDLPSAQAPALRNYLLWLKVNVFAMSTGFQVGSKVAGYLPPIPYPGSGYHRYTVLCFEQARPINVTALTRSRLPVRRYKFDVISFARLNGLGDPVAGNFFRVRVPAIHDEYYCKKAVDSNTCTKQPVCH